MDERVENSHSESDEQETLWRRDGTWERIHGALREELRRTEAREAEPSAAIIDSQSVKTTEKGGCMDMMPGRK
jgi:putative transposase